MDIICLFILKWTQLQICFRFHSGTTIIWLCGIINTEEAGILVFSGIPAFFVTIVLLVQRSTACNVHHAEPLFHQFHGGF